MQPKHLNYSQIEPTMRFVLKVVIPNLPEDDRKDVVDLFEELSSALHYHDKEEYESAADALLEIIGDRLPGEDGQNG